MKRTQADIDSDLRINALQGAFNDGVGRVMQINPGVTYAELMVAIGYVQQRWAREMLIDERKETDA